MSSVCRWLRQNTEEAKARLAVRGATPFDAEIDRILDLDEERRQLIGEGEALKARRNTVSQEVADRKRNGASADELIAEMRSVGDRVKEIDARLRDVEIAIEDGLLRIPNAPDPSVPEGGEENNPFSEAQVIVSDNQVGMKNLWIGNFFPDMKAWDKLEAHRLRGAGEYYLLLPAPDYAALAPRLPGPTCVLLRRPVFDMKLRNVIAGEPLPELVLVTNECEAIGNR